MSNFYYFFGKWIGDWIALTDTQLILISVANFSCVHKCMLITKTYVLSSGKSFIISTSIYTYTVFTYQFIVHFLLFPKCKFLLAGLKIYRVHYTFSRFCSAYPLVSSNINKNQVCILCIVRRFWYNFRSHWVLIEVLNNI